MLLGWSFRMRQPKHSVSVELPEAFAEFMRDVHQRIEDGDEAATSIESDDLLQCECVYGGLIDIANWQYGFRYFRTDNRTWDFILRADEISSIANGSTTHLTLWQCEKECGCFYASADAYCVHCDSIHQFDEHESPLRLYEPNADDSTRPEMANLRKVGLAILDYHHNHGCFPPHANVDASGKPLHSWRSLILPFLDEDGVFNMIDFDQPWDSDANKKVWDHQPSVYFSADCDPPRTQVVAVVGSKTIWPTSHRRRWTEITSGTSFTIAAVWANKLNTNWIEPADPDVDEVASDFVDHGKMVSVFVDGHVETIRDVSVERLRELLFI